MKNVVLKLGVFRRMLADGVLTVTGKVGYYTAGTPDQLRAVLFADTRACQTVSEYLESRHRRRQDE